MEASQAPLTKGKHTPGLQMILHEIQVPPWCGQLQCHFPFLGYSWRTVLKGISLLDRTWGNARCCLLCFKDQMSRYTVYTDWWFVASYIAKWLGHGHNMAVRYGNASFCNKRWDICAKVNDSQRVSSVDKDYSYQMIRVTCSVDTGCFLYSATPVII